MTAQPQKEPVLTLDAANKGIDRSAEPALKAAPAAAEVPGVDAHDPIEGDPHRQVFVSDGTSLEFFKKLKMAGSLDTTIHSGGIGKAIERMPNYSGVSLLIVDLSDSANPVADIEALADVCEPGVTVLTLGEVNDIRLYRTLIDSGIADYLVKPLTEDTFLEAANAALTPTAEGAGVAKGAQAKTVIFVSARGGVGGSTIALNTAAQVAQISRAKTLLLDLDLVFGSAAMSLDLEASRGLRDALEAPDRMDALLLGSATIKINQHFFVLATEEDVADGFRPNEELIGQLLAMLQPEYQTIVIDVPRELAITASGLLRDADQVVVVSDLTLTGLRDTNRLCAFIADQRDDNNVTLVANRTGMNKRGEISAGEFEKTVGRKLAANIPEDLKAAASINREARTVAEAARNSKLDKSIRTFAAQIGPAAKAEDKRGRKSKKRRR